MRFADRRDAGRQLGATLRGLLLSDPVVLALPRGGVPVAFEVAAALGAPLEVFVARKIGAPGQPEFGIGAIAEGVGLAVNDGAAIVLRLSSAEWDELVARERTELARRVERYRGGRALPELAGRDVVLVDDGLATGVTAEAALQSLRTHRPRRLVLAAPTCSPDTAERLGELADDVACVIRPKWFASVGQWYDDFAQTTDDEVVRLLEQAAAERPGEESNL